jgi:hypothetical protein
VPRLLIALAFAAAVLAQAPSQPAASSGTLLERDTQIEGGEFAVRIAGNEVIRYRFDSHTQVDRSGAASSVPLLRPGDEIEVASEPIPDSPLRYARAVHVTHALAPPRAIARTRATSSVTPSNSSLDSLFPRGDVTYSGVISYLADGRLMLRTRDAGDLTILLRQDTKYLAGGDIVKGTELKANMRVSVRAGKDIFGHIEAYQVMWGPFLQPR